MSRQKEIENAIKTFIYFDHSLDEKSLLLGMNWSDEFPEFKREEFIEKTINWMKSITYQEYPGGPKERIITDDMMEEYKQIIN